jgi:hypothetical protein
VAAFKDSRGSEIRIREPRILRTSAGRYNLAVRE